MHVFASIYLNQFGSTGKILWWLARMNRSTRLLDFNSNACLVQNWKLTSHEPKSLMTVLGSLKGGVILLARTRVSSKTNQCAHICKTKKHRLKRFVSKKETSMQYISIAWLSNENWLSATPWTGSAQALAKGRRSTCFHPLRVHVLF